ncbi:hypothetical protein U1Q18_035592 [Sarracenia purpurea var. burkii]
MAGTTIARSLIVSHFSSSISLCNRLFYASRLHFHPSPSPIPFTTITIPSYRPFSIQSARPFCSGTETIGTTKRNPKLVNFSLSDSDSESDDEDAKKTTATAKEIDKSKLPPPYDPFSKKPVIEEPEDPTNLQEVFHKIKTEGLFNNAVKMFDALSKDGLTHEALELFGQIKDKGHMPDVVAHTAVIEAYANAGQAKEALKVYHRMLASGVKPNAYTYAVLIKGLANSGDGKLLVEAKKYVMEMLEKGMRPNAGTYVAVFEAFGREGKAEEGREFLEAMKKAAAARGFVVEEKEVREVLRDRRGPVFRSVMGILFGK